MPPIYPQPPLHKFSTPLNMADVFGPDQNPFDNTCIFQYADIAIALSELKESIPLDRFKQYADSTIIHSLSDRNLFGYFTQYLSNHLQHTTEMLSNVDVITLVHYMVLSSTDNQFALNFQEIDSISLCELFQSEFDVDIAFFRDMDLDSTLLQNLAAFTFINNYRSCYKFMFPERFVRTCCEEQRRIYLKMFCTQSKMYNFVDQVSQQLLGFYDEIQSNDSKVVNQGLAKSTQVFLILEQIFVSMNFYKQFTRETIRTELTGIASLVMHFMVQTCNIVQYTVNIPCLFEIHNIIIEKLANCLEFLFEINKASILPVQADPFRTPVQSPNGLVIQYDNGVIQCLLEAIDILITREMQGCNFEILILQNLLCRIIVNQNSNIEFQELFKKHFLSTNMIQTMTQMCGKALQQFKNNQNMFFCNVMVDLLVSMYQTRLYVANNTVSKLVSTFTIQMYGNEQIRQKCCFMLEKLKTKHPLNSYFNDLNQYKSGFDRKIDYILCDQFYK